MKGCFLLQRQFAYIGHSLALLLKEKYGLNKFCGYIYLRQSYEFLKNQKDIEYSSLLLDEEIHKLYKSEALDLSFLKKMEEECGMPNLWHYLAMDRVIMFNQLVREYPYNTPIYTYEEMLKILQVKMRAIISFLDKEKPDFIFFSVIGAISGLLLHEIAQKRGIKILHLIHIGIRNKFTIINSFRQESGVKDLLAAGLKKVSGQDITEAKKFLEDFRIKPFTYDKGSSPQRQPLTRLKQFKFLLPNEIWKSFAYIIRIIHEYFTKTYRYDYSYIQPQNYIWDRIKRKTRNLIGADDLYDDLDPSHLFAFFPLHIEPEVATLLRAPFYTDQIHIIKQAARSLPVGYYLYVKDHPRMVVYRPRSYYKELKKIPNVKLLDPTIPIFEILLNAQLIITITGTAGWEGILLKKPVITFGDVFYNPLSFVKRCRSYEDLPLLVKQQLNDFKYDEVELIKFIAVLFAESIDVDLDYLWEHEMDIKKKKAMLEPLAGLIARRLSSLKINT